MNRRKAKTNTQDRFVIIVAGGRGERFWPVSRHKTPKQLLKLLGDGSFLQQAVDRVLPLTPLANIFIITTVPQVAEVQRQLPKLPKENVVAEPVRRWWVRGPPPASWLCWWRTTSSPRRRGSSRSWGGGRSIWRRADRRL